MLGWRAELAELQERLGELFGRADARRQANLNFEGRLSAVERKNGWPLAEQIGDVRPWGTVKLAESRLGQSRVGRLNGRDDNGSRPDLRRLSLPR